MLPQILPNFSTLVGLVTDQTTGPALGAPTAVPYHGTAGHQWFEGYSRPSCMLVCPTEEG